MLVKVDLSPLRTTKWHEYAVRFLLGGLITAIAGMIAKRFGPSIGGIFLAFPAIFPATATLAEKLETERKQKCGISGKRRGQHAAGIEAAGSAIGAIGLLAFAVGFWSLAERLTPWVLFLITGIIWAVVSAMLWYLRKRLFPLFRRHNQQLAHVHSRIRR